MRRVHAHRFAVVSWPHLQLVVSLQRAGHALVQLAYHDFCLLCRRHERRHLLLPNPQPFVQERVQRCVLAAVRALAAQQKVVPLRGTGHRERRRGEGGDTRTSAPREPPPPPPPCSAATPARPAARARAPSPPRPIAEALLRASGPGVPVASAPLPPAAAAPPPAASPPLPGERAPRMTNSPREAARGATVQLEAGGHKATTGRPNAPSALFRSSSSFSCRSARAAVGTGTVRA